MTVDVPDWMPESQQFLNLYLGVTTQIAALIASGNPAGNPGGVPLLALNNVLDKQTSKVLTPGASYASPVLSINQPSYDFALTLSFPAGTTQPWIEVVLAWNDSTIPAGALSTERWFLTGSSRGSSTYGGRGLTKGDSLQVVVTNLDTVKSVTFSYGISQHSRLVQRDDIRTIAFAPPGDALVAAPADIPNLVLGIMEAVALANAGNAQFYLPLYAGKVLVAVQEQPACRIVIRHPVASFDPVNVLPTDIIFDSGAIAANAAFSAVVTLPRSQCVVEIINNSGAVNNFFASVIAQDY